LNILTLDTSTELEYIGALIKGKTAEKAEDIPKTHAATLFENIDRVLSDAGGVIRDIDLIAVGIGPGSFTGIRIAVTTARMLAQLTGAALMGLYSHDMFATGAELTEGEYLLTAFDAKKNRVFGALYRQTGGAPEILVSPGDYSIDELASRVPEGSRLITTGSGILRFKEEVDTLLPSSEFIGGTIPEINRLVEIIEKKYQENSGEYRDISKVVPCHARKSDAEIAMEKKKSSSHP